MTIIQIVIIFVLGLLFGSFYNVVAIRLVKQASFVLPPSHCPHCRHELRAFELIPVISYFFLKGRCRYCSVRISWRYPLGELITAILFVMMYLRFGFTPELLVALLFTSILILITQTDIESMIIPNAIVIVGIMGAIGLRLWIHPLPLWDYAIAAFIGSGLLLLIGVIGARMLKRDAMGGGDIKLYVFIGLILGINLTVLSLFFASLFGLIYGLCLKATRKVEKYLAIPFGPFIALGSIIVYLWGNDLVAWYLSLL